MASSEHVAAAGDVEVTVRDATRDDMPIVHQMIKVSVGPRAVQHGAPGRSAVTSLPCLLTLRCASRSHRLRLLPNIISYTIVISSIVITSSYKLSMLLGS